MVSEQLSPSRAKLSQVWIIRVDNGVVVSRSCVECADKVLACHVVQVKIRIFLDEVLYPVGEERISFWDTCAVV